ncbi:MAG: TspO/MBR family protein [Steroidobacteraceae bacterium]
MRIEIDRPTSYRGRNARPNWLALLAFIALALAAGALGAVFSPRAAPSAVRGAETPAPGAAASSQAWYASLKKPAWTPPAAWYGPVWTLLYVLMGTAVWLVWSERYHPARNIALLAYAFQLALNASWAPVFFGARNVGAGLFLIVALWLALVWTLREFSAVRAAAAWLMLPHLAWVSLGVALNLSIWRHNP